VNTQSGAEGVRSAVEPVTPVDPSRELELSIELFKVNRDPRRGRPFSTARSTVRTGRDMVRRTTFVPRAALLSVPRARQVASGGERGMMPETGPAPRRVRCPICAKEFASASEIPAHTTPTHSAPKATRVGSAAHLSTSILLGLVFVGVLAALSMRNPTGALIAGAGGLIALGALYGFVVWLVFFLPMARRALIPALGRVIGATAASTLRPGLLGVSLLAHLIFGAILGAALFGLAPSPAVTPVRLLVGALGGFLGGLAMSALMMAALSMKGHPAGSMAAAMGVALGAPHGAGRPAVGPIDP
jgi:hypothetical protein